MSLQKQIYLALSAKKALVKRKAAGRIKYDYLVPWGPYEEQWDWDGYFIGMALASEIPSEAVYLKNWALNYLERVSRAGFTPGLLTPKGTDRRLKHVKPFLAQGCYFAGKFLKDFFWIKPHWQSLKRSVSYRKRTYFDYNRKLAAWFNSMESGVDNNVTVFDFPNGTVLAADLNTFLHLEYKALAKLATCLGLNDERKIFEDQAARFKQAILTHLWDAKDKTIYNLNRQNGQFIKRVTHSNFLPLFAGLLPKDKGRLMIKKYLLNPNKLWSRYGIRTLAKDDVAYNNANIIKPYSNWQGPVWPIVNYFGMHALINYGFKKEAKQLAERTVKLCLNDIQKTGGMHENYHAETGKPLAAPDFISWNLLVGNIISEAETGLNPFKI